MMFTNLKSFPERKQATSFWELNNSAIRPHFENFQFDLSPFKTHASIVEKQVRIHRSFYGVVLIINRKRTCLVELRKEGGWRQVD